MATNNDKLATSLNNGCKGMNEVAKSNNSIPTERGLIDMTLDELAVYINQ